MFPMTGVVVVAVAVAVGQVTSSMVNQDVAYVDDIFQQVMARMEHQIDDQMEPLHKQQMLRDQEYLQHGPSLVGHQYMTGGAGEGMQHLSPDGKIPNVQEVKTDAHLPAYCNPPNPCPVGRTEKDGCMENMPNDAAFVRTYQEKQTCMCDREHMISCPPDNSHATDSMSSAIDQMLLSPQGDGLLGGNIDRVAKKGDGWKASNPYLKGDKLPTVAKKSPVY